MKLGGIDEAFPQTINQRIEVTLPLNRDDKLNTTAFVMKRHTGMLPSIPMVVPPLEDVGQDQTIRPGCRRLQASTTELQLLKDSLRVTPASGGTYLVLVSNLVRSRVSLLHIVYVLQLKQIIKNSGK